MPHIALYGATLAKYVLLAFAIGFGIGYFLAWRKYGKAITTLNRMLL